MKYNNYGKKSILEKSEDIEILRFFEWNQPIRVVEVTEGSLAVDEPKDLINVKKALKKLSKK